MLFKITQIYKPNETLNNQYNLSFQKQQKNCEYISQDEDTSWNKSVYNNDESLSQRQPNCTDYSQDQNTNLFLIISH